jgi:hypothetical protein
MRVGGLVYYLYQNVVSKTKNFVFSKKKIYVFVFMTILQTRLVIHFSHPIFVIVLSYYDYHICLDQFHFNQYQI